MSKVTRMVELTPPKGCSTKELMTSPGHTCRYCGGRGYFKGVWCRHDEPKTCPICGGSGQVDAVVTIEWKPKKGG